LNPHTSRGQAGLRPCAGHVSDASVGAPGSSKAATGACDRGGFSRERASSPSRPNTGSCRPASSRTSGDASRAPQSTRTSHSPRRTRSPETNADKPSTVESAEDHQRIGSKPADARSTVKASDRERPPSSAGRRLIKRQSGGNLASGRRRRSSSTRGARGPSPASAGTVARRPLVDENQKPTASPEALLLRPSSIRLARATGATASPVEASVSRVPDDALGHRPEGEPDHGPRVAGDHPEVEPLRLTGVEPARAAAVLEREIVDLFSLVDHVQHEVRSGVDHESVRRDVEAHHRVDERNPHDAGATAVNALGDGPGPAHRTGRRPRAQPAPPLLRA
jgi:hypothetical protein